MDIKSGTVPEGLSLGDRRKRGPYYGVKKMKKCFNYLTLLLVLLGLVVGYSEAATYYADPVNGNNSNPGSAALPWKTLAEVVSTGKITTLASGDTLLLRSGYHGSVSLSGNNAQIITIAAESGQKPELSKLIFTSGSKWTIKGLTISPSFATPYTGGYIVTLAEGGASSEIVLEDCFIYNVLDTSAWTAADWMGTNSGIFMGRYGTNITLRNNFVYNTRFGIALCSFNSLCEGNVVSDFSADGLRATRDGETVQYNVIKNCYVDAAAGDANHDDGMQCFLFNVGTGLVKDITVRGNVIVNRTDANQKFPATMQGIGFFDGPLQNFLVEKNVVLNDSYHGISLYDAQNCKILGNAVYSYWWQTSGMKPWILLGQKTNQASGNTVRDNLAMSFSFTADPLVTASDNNIVTPVAFENALVAAMTEINVRFGPVHALSGRARLDGYLQTSSSALTTITGGTAAMLIYPSPISKAALGSKTVKFMCTSSKVFDLIIYDATGNVLLSLPSGASSGNSKNYQSLGIAEWDGTTSSGNKCSRGIYYYSVRDSNGRTKTGKIAVE